MHLRRLSPRLLFLAVMVLPFTACARATPPPTPTAAPSPTPYPTFTPYPTLTPPPTYTPYPTYTPLPVVIRVVTGTPLPTYTPYPTYTPLPTPTVAPTQPVGPPVYPWQEAGQHVGEYAAVEGTVVRTYNAGSVIFLNFAQEYQGTFTVVIFADDAAKFPQPPEQLYLNRYIRVTGEISEYRGTPQIIVRHPGQIEIVR